MQLTLAGQTAIVTGGSLGLGKATAQSFYQAGAKVAILARRQSVIDATVAELNEQPSPEGAQLIGLRCDVADADELAAAHDQIAAQLGAVDIVVNNAGQAAAKPFMQVSDAEWQADLDLKLFAAVRLTRLVWPGMVERRHGRIINLLNTAAKAPGANSAPTSVSRAAGMALTKVLANEGAEHNILVNALLIGMLKSDQVRRWHDASGSDASLDEYVEQLGARLPMGRMGEAEECANLCLFLASSAASYITGCAINMDGGLSKVV